MTFKGCLRDKRTSSVKSDSSSARVTGFSEVNGGWGEELAEGSGDSKGEDEGTLKKKKKEKADEANVSISIPKCAVHFLLLEKLQFNW